jgi:hypothetical protein
VSYFEEQEFMVIHVTTIFFILWISCVELDTLILLSLHPNEEDFHLKAKVWIIVVFINVINLM